MEQKNPSSVSELAENIWTNSIDYFVSDHETL